jgi:hypothetical protein
MGGVRIVRVASMALLACQLAVGLLVPGVPAAADPGGPIATCRSTDEAGVDTDTCVGNPGVVGGSQSQPRVDVVPCFTIGIGIGFGSGGCDD